MRLTTEQKQGWEDWLAERPENVRRVAQEIVPWKSYRMGQIEDDINNRYSPISYEEEEDGTVTITCRKTNEDMPFLGNYDVFRIRPEDLIEAN